MRIALVGLVILTVVGLPVASHHRPKARLRAYWVELQAAGDKPTIDELRPVLSSAETEAGTELVASANRLSSGWVNAPTMKMLAPGRALAACQEAVLPTDTTTNVWPELALLHEQQAETLGAASEILSRPGFGFEHDLHHPQSFQVASLSRTKSVAQCLSLAATVELHDGQITNAYDDLEALTSLVAKWRPDSIMVCELVRVAIAAIAISPTWEALQYPEGQDQQLRTLQALWQSVDFLSQAESALNMHRQFAENLFAAARQSPSAVNSQLGSGSSGLSELAQLGKDLVNDPGKGFKNVVQRYPGYWRWSYCQSYDDQIAHDKTLRAARDAVRRARNAGVPGLAVSEFERATGTLHSAFSPEGRWLGISTVGTVGTFLRRIRNIEIERSLLLGALALKRYELKHGVYPHDLGALCPDFVTEVPRDPIDGKPLRYQLQTDGTFLLYSVGEDGVDDGGDPEILAGGVRQWWRARDAVWPLRATREQVESDLSAVRAQFQKQGTPDPMQEFKKRYGLVPSAGRARPGTGN